MRRKSLPLQEATLQRCVDCGHGVRGLSFFPYPRLGVEVGEQNPGWVMGARWVCSYCYLALTADPSSNVPLLWIVDIGLMAVSATICPLWLLPQLSGRPCHIPKAYGYADGRCVVASESLLDTYGLKGPKADLWMIAGFLFVYL